MILSRIFQAKTKGALARRLSKPKPLLLAKRVFVLGLACFLLSETNILVRLAAQVLAVIKVLFL